MPTPPTPLTPGQAVAAITMHAIVGDGSVTAEEHETLHDALGDFRELWNTESVENALHAVHRRMRTQGPERLLEDAIAAVPLHLQGPLLETVRELAASDGDPTQDEDSLLARLSGAFVATRKKR